MNAITTIQFDPKDVWSMAAKMAASRLFGVKTPEEAFSLMMIAQAEGSHPAMAMRDYHVIQGRPSLKADAMLARFQQAGGSVKWGVYTDTKVAGAFSHPAGGSVEIEWTIDMAKRAGLANKDNWRNYPRAQLRARCISEGIRTVYPACVCGVYTPEEVQDFSPAETVKRADVTVTVTDAPKPDKPFTEPLKQGSPEWQAEADNFDLPGRAVQPPTDPEAAAMDEKINGPAIDPEHKVPTALKPRKMVALKDLDREHAERALKLAEWQVTKTKEFSAQHNEGTKNIPILTKLLATMPQASIPTAPPPVEPAATDATEPSGPSYGDKLSILIEESEHKTSRKVAEAAKVDYTRLVDAINDKATLTEVELTKLEAAGVNVKGLA